MTVLIFHYPIFLFKVIYLIRNPRDVFCVWLFFSGGLQHLLRDQSPWNNILNGSSKEMVSEYKIWKLGLPDCFIRPLFFFFLTQLDVSTSHQRMVIRLHHHWNLNFLSPHNYLAKQQNLSQPLCLPDQKLS